MPLAKNCKSTRQLLFRPRAPRLLKITNEEVELARQLFEEFPVGHPQHMGYRVLARKFELSRTCMRNICLYLKRR